MLIQIGMNKTTGLLPLFARAVEGKAMGVEGPVDLLSPYYLPLIPL